MAKKLLSATESVFGKESKLRSGQDFLSSVETRGLAEGRAEWRAGVGQAFAEDKASLETLGLKSEDLVIRDDGAESTSMLELRSGEKLRVEEVVERTKTVGDLRLLLEEEREFSIFRWESVIGPVTRKMSADDLEGVAELFGGKSHYSHIAALLSKQLLSLGEAERAWGLGARALDQSSSSGWVVFYDGGSRIQSLEALNAIDAGRARALAYETFGVDAMVGRWDAYGIARNLRELAPIFCSSVPSVEVWGEVKKYLDPQ